LDPAGNSKSTDIECLGFGLHCGVAMVKNPSPPFKMIVNCTFTINKVGVTGPNQEYNHRKNKQEIN
jgi:hypothetical protein